MSPSQLSTEFRRRVVIENVHPEVDAGRFPIRRSVNEKVAIDARIHADGADQIAAVIQYRPVKESAWKEVPLLLSNAGKDLWEGAFIVDTLGRYDYTLQAWIDEFGSWRRDLKKKADAGQDVKSELLEGARLVRDAAGRANGADSDSLRRLVDVLNAGTAQESRVKAILDEPVLRLMDKYPDRREATTYSVLNVVVERERARTGAWYEMFPRSAGNQTGAGVSLRVAEGRIPGVAKMGFDVLYLPPVHPIGESFRKGPNNNPQAKPEDPGSPWAIGSKDGGHKSVDPNLGTLEDFDHFVAATKKAGLELAIDIAFQCSPDHPYVREHPEWFRHRPDGTIKYAENPPKKYEDIYPLDFECESWQALWQELRDVVLFWAKRGVMIFRVDNPHTKPYRFWEWMIGEVQEKYPKTIFLAEAFTRPQVMQYLAKCGFSQSYTYFTWRNTKVELTEYLTELTQTSVRDYLRPNFFANTPDILPPFLQTGGRPAFQIRFILAATLAANYGIYGPPFELCEGEAFPDTEDYVDSEKYQTRVWDWDRPGNIKDLITKVNGIRHEYSALQANGSLRFHPVTNDQLLCYSKTANDFSHIILVVVNLNPKQTQAGWVQLPLQEWKLPADFQVHDLLTDKTFNWHGESNFVQLNPQEMPAHVLKISYGQR